MRGVCRWMLAAALLICLHQHAEAVRDPKFYKVLDISEDADEQTIKKAYRKAAMKWHPDRNPDNKEKAEAKFREIAGAYEVLSDPEKRKVYDQVGEEGMKQNAGQGGQPGGNMGGAHFQFQGDPFDMFNQFFGGQNPFGGQGMGGMGGMGGMNMGGKRRRAQQGQSGGRGGGGPGLYDSDPNVITLTQSNFPGPKDTGAWLLEFYAPWCGHCRNLASKWSKVAASLKGVVKVGAVNCDDEKQLCGQHGVQGYPTIKAMSKGKVRPYEGARSAGALKSFALSLLSSKAITSLNKPAQVEEFLNWGGAKTPKKASWGVNTILFTSKSDTAPLTKSLASQYEGRIAFGESRASNQVLSEQFKVSSYPTLLAFCNGDTSNPIRYNGDFKQAPLAKFLKEFEAGKKCAKQVKIDPSTDFSQMKAGHLKELLQDRGISCTECTEKQDYVAKAREVFSQEAKTEL